MIKRTLYFGNPAYLNVRLAQLEIRLPEVEKNDTLPESFKASMVKRIPIEDIGVVVLDHKQITITQAALGVICQRYKFKSKSQQIVGDAVIAGRCV